MRDKKTESELITAQEGQAFNVWDLPSFDAPPSADSEPAAVTETEQSSDDAAEVRVEEVAIEEVKPLTLDEVEAIRQDAWNEGFSTGEKDGFHAGQLKAAQEAEVALENKVQALEKIMHALFEPIASQDQELEEAMLDMVMHISQQVIQRELKIDSSQIKQVVRESLKLLPMGSEAVRVHVNPQDFEQIKALRERHEGNWRIVEDDDLLPGGCRFESLNTQINATVETRIEHIATQILEQQRELRSQPLEADLQIPLTADQQVAPAAEDAAADSPTMEQQLESDSSSVAVDNNSTVPPLAEGTPRPEPAAEPEPEPVVEPATEQTASVADTADQQPADDSPQQH